MIALRGIAGGGAVNLALQVRALALQSADALGECLLRMIYGSNDLFNGKVSKH
jgi:hypothetical protein